jgi:hypothetical protein
MTAVAIIAALLALLALMLAVAHAGRATRLQRDRKRLEAMDERRAADRLYAPERRLEVAPQDRPPTP